MSKTRRGIFCQRDLEFFLKSKAYRDLTSFVQKIANTIMGKKLSAECPVSDVKFKIMLDCPRNNKYVRNYFYVGR